MQKQISTLWGIIIIVAVAIALFGGVFAWQYVSKTQTPTPNAQPNLNEQTQTSELAPSETAGWKTFDSGDGFEFKYPEINSFIAMNELRIMRGGSGINNNGCFIGTKNDEYPNPITEKRKFLINNTQFCISETGDSAMGRNYPTYFYTTTYKNGEYFTLIFSFSVTSCDWLKGGESYNPCLIFFNNPSNNVENILENILSTFKQF